MAALEGFRFLPHANAMECVRCRGLLRMSDVARLVERGADASAIRCSCDESTPEVPPPAMIKAAP